MSTTVVRAPQTTGVGEWLPISVAIGLIALALVGAVLVFSSDDSPIVSGAAVRSGGGPDEARIADAVSRGSGESNDVPPGSGVTMGRTPYAVPEPNLLQK